MRWLLAACYPVLAHLALMRQQAALEWIALTALFAAVFYTGLRNGRRFEWLAFAVFAGATGALILVDAHGYALYLPPLVFPSLVLISFACSLLPGRVPLVTRIATFEHGGQLPPQLVAYTHRLTWMWSGLLALVLSVDAALLAFGSRESWSLWANFYGYLFVGAVFAVEYIYRRLRFRKLPQPGVVKYIRRLAQAGAAGWR